MTVRNLDHLFRPASIAVIGASNRPQSVGATVMHNLLTSGFEGPILPVNPKRQSIAGVLAYPSVGDLPLAPDLAVICTPPETLPGLIAQLGAQGTKAAIVLTAGFEVSQSHDGLDYRKAVLEAARPHLLRILGPNCVGLLAPHARLNASIAPQAAIPGSLAFISQSGARGVVRIVCDPDGTEAEFAIVVHSKMKGRGLGTVLPQKIVDYCRERGVEQIVGQVLADNRAMLALAKNFGFRLQASADRTVKELRLRLAE